MNFEANRESALTCIGEKKALDIPWGDTPKCKNLADYTEMEVRIVLTNYSKDFLNQDNFQPNWNVYLPFVILENKVK